MATLMLENKKQLITIVLALVFGGVAAVGTGQYVSKSVESQTARIAKDYEKKNVSIIKEIENVKKGVQQLATNQKMLEKAQQDIPKLMAQQKEQSAPLTNVVDKSVSFSGKTPSGKRAITIMIDSLSAVGGLLNPGDFVDIIAQLDIPREIDPENKEAKENVETVTTVLFQNVQVLAVGTNFREAGNNAVYAAQQKSRSLNVTLAVGPDEAGLISFAQLNGKLQLSLRAPRENRAHLLQVASWDTLSDYLLERQGTRIAVPKLKVVVQEEEGEYEDEVESYIQIFSGGKEL